MPAIRNDAIQLCFNRRPNATTPQNHTQTATLNENAEITSAQRMQQCRDRCDKAANDMSPHPCAKLSQQCPHPPTILRLSSNGSPRSAAVIIVSYSRTRDAQVSQGDLPIDQLSSRMVSIILMYSSCAFLVVQGHDGSTLFPFSFSLGLSSASSLVSASPFSRGSEEVISIASLDRGILCMSPGPGADTLS